MYLGTWIGKSRAQERDWYWKFKKWDIFERMGSHRDKAQSKKKDKEAPEPALPETAALKRWLKSSSGAGSQERKF